MKRLLSLLIVNSIISTSSISVISCNQKYENKFNSIVQIIEKINDAPLIDYDINTTFDNPNTIFAIKNALGLTMNDMNYVSLKLLNDNKVELNKPIELEINIKVLDYQKSFIKDITVSNSITSNISSTQINSINILKNKQAFLSTNNGLYTEESPFSFHQINFQNNISAYVTYQLTNGTIYVATNEGLYYSDNGINFFKNNNFGNYIITQIIQDDKNNSVYIKTKNNGLYISDNNGMTFQKINTSLIINGIEKYNHQLYVCTSKSIYKLNETSFEDVPVFDSLSNVSTIKWITNNTAYIVASNELWYYKYFIGNFYILKKISNSNDAKTLGTINYITDQLSNIENFIFISTSTGLFYIDKNNDIWNSQINNFNYFQINSLFPYSIYCTGNFNGLKIFTMPIDDILKGV